MLGKGSHLFSTILRELDALKFEGDQKAVDSMPKHIMQGILSLSEGERGKWGKRSHCAWG
jgi:hypothetical protein